MAKIRDVAQKAGVGVATVSRMLNESGYVSEAAKEKIRLAMEELNYTPNELARNLYHKKTGIIAIVVPTIAHPFYSEYINYAEMEIQRRGFKTMICNASAEGNEELEYLDMLNRHIVDGVISGTHTLDIEEYQKIKKPIVSLDRYLGEDIPVVAVDHIMGGRLASQVLLESGCRKVLHFRGETSVDAPYHDRHTEFSRIMQKNNVQVVDYELGWNCFDVEYYQKVIDEVFADGWDYDGVFGVDQLANICMNELLKRQKKIPEDVKIVGYDGTYISKLSRIKMTTVVQPINELAKESVRLILARMEGAQMKNERILLDVKLAHGDTTLSSQSTIR